VERDTPRAPAARATGKVAKPASARGTRGRNRRCRQRSNLHRPRGMADHRQGPWKEDPRPARLSPLERWPCSSKPQLGRAKAGQARTQGGDRANGRFGFEHISASSSGGW